MLYSTIPSPPFPRSRRRAPPRWGHTLPIFILPNCSGVLPPPKRLSDQALGDNDVEKDAGKMTSAVSDVDLRI